MTHKKISSLHLHPEVEKFISDKLSEWSAAAGQGSLQRFEQVAVKAVELGRSWRFSDEGIKSLVGLSLTWEALALYHERKGAT